MTETPSSPRPATAPGPHGNGLTSAEARRRLASGGYNEMPGHRPRTLLGVLRDVLREPMFLLLLGAASVYFVLGDSREALVLLGSIVIVIVITVLQERRTERTLSRLRDLSSPRALVLRDGIEQRIPGREVVVDDLVLVREGDRVPADGRVLSATGLSVDESILTGESLAVDKVPVLVDESPTSPSGSSKVYAATLVTSGFATVLVTATGVDAEVGRIGRVLSTLVTEPTPLFREVGRLVRWVAAAGLALCAAIAIIYATTRGDWLGGVLAGITVAMGVLPEEFPVVLTVFLAMGAWRISRNGVLTRRMPAVETIGSATVLAVDKTGTLTENRMKVALLAAGGTTCDLRQPDAGWNDQAALVLATALAASERSAFDPMERAIHEAAAQRHLPEVAALKRMRLVREYDLTPELLAVTHVWEHDGSARRDIAVKGAPETVFSLCGLSPASVSTLLESVRGYASQGLRVLGVARGRFGDGPLPGSPTEFELKFVGLLCLADPVRSDVPSALAECKAAGIRVVMITGDHPGTALAIAGQAGFETEGGVLTGAEIASLSTAELAERTRTVNIYARTTPENKLQLIEAFKANGEVVVMTGDGVNDAPALKSAHVGVAMGSRGTDVAREAAALVLVNDDFASLVGAVRLGRRIYDNIQHAMSYLVAIHIPIAGMGLLPVLFGWPLLLFPLHVLFLEFVIDPACSLVFEADAEDSQVMRRPPRSPAARLFSMHALRHSLIMGSLALLNALAVYFIALNLLPEREARALAFVAMVIANLLLIFVYRAQGESLRRTLARPNSVFWSIIVLALAALALAVEIPAAATLFAFATPPLAALGLVVVAALGLMLPAALLSRHRGGHLD